MFFGELEVSGAQDLFRRFNVGQLPYVFRLAPSLSLAGSGNVKLAPDDVLKVEHVGHYPFLASDFANFVRGGYRAAPVSLLHGCHLCPSRTPDSLPRCNTLAPRQRYSRALGGRRQDRLRLPCCQSLTMRI